MRKPDQNGISRSTSRADSEIVRENNDFISEESDQQSLLIREQDEQLDFMSHSLTKIGQLGLAISDEVVSQDKLITEIHEDVENTNNRLAAVQKKMTIILNKAGVKGQLCLLIALIMLILTLIVLIVYT